jgi:hypothetical protein
MNVAPRLLLVTIFTLVAAVGCSPAATRSSSSSPASTPASPTSPLTRASTSTIDYVALDAETETAISTGPALLDNVRAVLVNVGGETKIAHYRHGFTDNDHGHVFSVTKSVLSILIGIAIADGLINRGTVPRRRSLERSADRAVRVDQKMHVTGDIRNQGRQPSQLRVWPALVDHREAQAGWILRSWLRRATHLRAAEIAGSDRLPVGRATGQPDR